MAILTDLPNELLLKIIADVSPLYLDLFLLSCKRIQFLGADARREFHRAKNRFTGLGPCDLLEEVFSDASIALYQTWITLPSSCETDSQDSFSSVNAQALEHRFKSRHGSREQLAIPLLFTHLLNLRKLRLGVGNSPYLIEIVAQIVQASHQPSLEIQEPLALGRLTKVKIWARCSSILHGNEDGFCTHMKGPNHGMKLSSLLAMIPTVRKLEFFGFDRSRYVSQKPYHTGGVTELYLSGAVDSSFLEDLIGRTKSLEKFTYEHELGNTKLHPADFAPHRVAKTLQQDAGDSLLFLDMILYPYGYVTSNDRLRRYRKDLFLGPLHGFMALKTLRTSVDLLIQTHRIGRNHAKTHAKTGTVQSLMSFLPPCLESLILYEGLEEWDADTMELLFEDITEWKEQGIAKLKWVNFVKCPSFEVLMSAETKTACRMAGVKLGYSKVCCHYWSKKGCEQIFCDLGCWEWRPWIDLVRCCEEESEVGLTSEYSWSD